MKFEWHKLGKIISCNEDIPWMATWTGASYARRVDNSNLYEIFVTGRDNKNRSKIGKIIIDITDPTKVLHVDKNEIFSLGDLGAFDENGVSYPWLFTHNNETYMLYVGWRPTVLTPFTLGLGLAKELCDGLFQRVSRAPILPLNNEDYLSIGSCGTFKERDKIRLYYTSFLKWGTSSGEHKHYYVIKYAESSDGIHWERNNHICINAIYDDEFSICRPSVIKINDVYHMWFSYRGENYSLGYAYSIDGINWIRDDAKAGIAHSNIGWDSKMQCYSHVFQHDDDYYMLYCGNNYGKEGVGIAKLNIIHD